MATNWNVSGIFVLLFFVGMRINMAKLIVAYKKSHDANIFISTPNSTPYWKYALTRAIEECLLEEISRIAKNGIPVLDDTAFEHILQEVMDLPQDMAESQEIARKRGWEFSVRELHFEEEI